MRRGGQRNFRAAQAFCPELSLHTWTGASNEDEYGNYVLNTPLNTQAMSFQSVSEERENVAQKAHFFKKLFLQKMEDFKWDVCHVCALLALDARLHSVAGPRLQRALSPNLLNARSGGAVCNSEAPEQSSGRTCARLVQSGKRL